MKNIVVFINGFNDVHARFEGTTFKQFYLIGSRQVLIVDLTLNIENSSQRVLLLVLDPHSTSPENTLPQRKSLPCTLLSNR